jgi:hypothetical protein
MPVVRVMSTVTVVADVPVVTSGLVTDPNIGDAEKERKRREDETEKETPEENRIQQVVDDKHRQPPTPVASSKTLRLLIPLPGVDGFEFADATPF